MVCFVKTSIASLCELANVIYVLRIRTSVTGSEHRCFLDHGALWDFLGSKHFSTKQSRLFFFKL